MHKIWYFIILIVLMLGIIASSPAQQLSLKIPIVAEKKPLGLYAFTYQGKKIFKVSEFESIMADCPEALSKLLIAKKYERAWGRFVIGAVGGSLVGVFISVPFVNPYRDDIVGYVSCAVIGASIGVGSSIGGIMLYQRPINKYCKEAVDIYNASIIY